MWKTQVPESQGVSKSFRFHTSKLKGKASSIRKITCFYHYAASKSKNVEISEGFTASHCQIVNPHNMNESWGISDSRNNLDCRGFQKSEGLIV